MQFNIHDLPEDQIMEDLSKVLGYINDNTLHKHSKIVCNDMSAYIIQSSEAGMNLDIIQQIEKALKLKSETLPRPQKTMYLPKMERCDAGPPRWPEYIPHLTSYNDDD